MDVKEALKLREWVLKKGMSEKAIIECLKFIAEKNEIKPFRVVIDENSV